MKKIAFLLVFNLLFFLANAQIKWVNIDSLYKPLPFSFHIYKSADSLDGKPNVIYYTIADLKDKNLKFTTDTTYQRRLTPSQFFQKDNQPLLVVNGSFFSFATNQNLNIVVKEGRIVSYNEQTIAGRGKDTLTYFHSLFGTLGISKKRKADIAWIYSDSSKRLLYASQYPVYYLRDSLKDIHLNEFYSPSHFRKWEMQTAIGGGPVLLQNGQIDITNNEERKFPGKQINNHEPRTAIGYTKGDKIIILVAEGRSKSAAGITLIQEAKILKSLGCVEALNLDGGGSSCMLINGKQTNTPSSKGVQRPVPSVFLVEKNDL